MVSFLKSCAVQDCASTAHLLVVDAVLPCQLQDAGLGSTSLAKVVHLLQNQPHIILPPREKAVYDSRL
jgi:hypothetical protein